MVIRRIVMVVTVANQPHQKVSIHSFVMMKRDQIKIIKTKNGSDEQNRKPCQKPGAIRDLNSRRFARRRVIPLLFVTAAFSAMRRWLRLRDFVEAVPTYFSHDFKSGKKLIVNTHQIPLKRADNRVLDSVFP